MSSCRRGEAAKPDQIRWSSPLLSGNSFPRLSRHWGNLESLKVNLTPLSKPASCLRERRDERGRGRSDEEERKVKEGWRDQWVHLTPSLAQPTLISAKLSASNWPHCVTCKRPHTIFARCYGYQRRRIEGRSRERESDKKWHKQSIIGLDMTRKTSVDIVHRKIMCVLFFLTTVIKM